MELYMLMFVAKLFILFTYFLTIFSLMLHQLSYAEELDESLSQMFGVEYQVLV